MSSWNSSNCCNYNYLLHESQISRLGEQEIHGDLFLVTTGHALDHRKTLLDNNSYFYELRNNIVRTFIL